MVPEVIQGDYGCARTLKGNDVMTAAKSIEYRITRQLLRQGERVEESVNTQVVNRVIRVAAATVAVVLLGSYSQELLWVLVAASTVLALGIKE
jgi:ABC-type bacteriocin/lantibiotic exporter with double-glycine peptidase domain